MSFSIQILMQKIRIKKIFKMMKSLQMIMLNRKKLRNMIGGKDIIQLKINHIPKGLIPLENLFDKNDVAKNTKVHPDEDDI